MVFVTFKDKENFDKSREIVSKVGYPVTYLSGKQQGLHNCVHVLADHTVKEFDGQGIDYNVLDREGVKSYLSGLGEQYLSRLESCQPHLVNLPSKKQSIDPGRKTICFLVEDEREYDAVAVVEEVAGDFDYDRRHVQRGVVKISGESRISKPFEFLEIKGTVGEQHIDDIVRRLADENLCGYSRETQVLVSDAYKKD
ncbi:hypothetical protein ACFL3V_02105 [Nanoarchaeota archaeon]